MPTADERWLDEEAGRLIRPYAVTRGRTRPTGERLDLIAMVTAVAGPPPDPQSLDPEPCALLELCHRPASVADLAADLDLPIGVVQVLVSDLRDRGLIRVRNPVPPAHMTDLRILREVADGLRRL